MPHLKNRHILPLIHKQGSFWPIVAILGARQSGKSTILRDITNVGKYVTFDDQDALEDAQISAKNFLTKMPTPLIIDEVQKVPSIFDALKLAVDKKKISGTYFLSGSMQFSAKLGIRESLTGRIGILYLYPLTLAEAHQVSFEVKRCDPNSKLKQRFETEYALKQFLSGGFPVPAFLRSEELISQYFQNWVDTTIFRDAARIYGRGYNPDLAFAIIERLAATLKNGEYATLRHFKQTSVVVRRYLQAFEDVFLVQKITAHSEAVGSDIWTFFDTGVFSFLNKGIVGDGTQLSLARIFILKEVRALCEYSQRRLKPQYYKTARSGVVDFIWDNRAIKVSNLPQSQVDYDARPAHAAVKKLKLDGAVILWPHDHSEKTSKEKIAKLFKPWTCFS